MRVRGHRPFEPESCLMGPELLKTFFKLAFSSMLLLMILVTVKVLIR